MSNKRENVTVHRLVPATPEEVYKAWIDPSVRKKWWGPGNGFHCSVCDIDGKVGGSFRIGMKKEDKEFINYGKFIELVPHQKISFSFTWEHDPEAAANSIVTIELFPAELDGKKATELVLTHEKLASAESRSDHNEGWLHCLQSLSNFYGAESNCCT